MVKEQVQRRGGAIRRSKPTPGKRTPVPTARRWAWLFVVTVTVCLIVYAANIVVSELSPANAWGLTYGAGAAGLMVAAGLYGARRRAMALASKLRLGNARGWLYLHVYGGGLFLLLALMHSGFRLPSGPVTWWLWALSLWTVASGLVGLTLQQWLPRTLGSALALEVLYERIPELVAEIRDKAEALVASCAEPVQALYARRVAPALAAPERRLIYFLDITGGKQSQLKEFDYLRRFLPAEDKEKLGELVQLYKAKLDVDAHYTLQTALRGWLWIHVPTSIALYALLILHLFAVYRY
jgi:hypothetical protein